MLFKVAELRSGDFEADGDLLHAAPPSGNETGRRTEPRRAVDCGAAAEGEEDACRWIGQAQECACAGLGTAGCLFRAAKRRRAIDADFLLMIGFSASASFMHSMANCRHLALTQTKVASRTVDLCNFLPCCCKTMKNPSKYGVFLFSAV